MFRLNRIRVKLSGALKRQQCGILHNRVSKHMVKTWWIEEYIIVPFLLLQHSPWTAQLCIMCCSYYTIGDVCPKRLWKRAEAKFSKLWFASKADRPTQTRSLHMRRALVLFIQCCSSAVRNGLLSEVFYSYMSAQVTIFEKWCTSSLACNAGSLWIVQLYSKHHNMLGTISYAQSCMHVTWTNEMLILLIVIIWIIIYEH